MGRFDSSSAVQCLVQPFLPPQPETDGKSNIQCRMEAVFTIAIMLYLQPILVNAAYVHTDVARKEPHNLLLPEIFCPISL